MFFNSLAKNKLNVKPDFYRISIQFTVKKVERILRSLLSKQLYASLYTFLAIFEFSARTANKTCLKMFQGTGSLYNLLLWHTF